MNDSIHDLFARGRSVGARFSNNDETPSAAAARDRSFPERPPRSRTASQRPAASFASPSPIERGHGTVFALPSISILAAHLPIDPRSS